MSQGAPGLLARPLVRIACAVLGTAVLVVSVWAAGAQAVLASLGVERPRAAAPRACSRR